MAMQGPGCKVATAYFILDFAVQAEQAKGRLKNVDGQINVSGLLVFYQLISRVDKSTSWRWSYVCPKRWLKIAKSCQCLSPKSGFFTSVAASPRLTF